LIIVANSSTLIVGYNLYQFIFLARINRLLTLINLRTHLHGVEFYLDRPDTISLNFTKRMLFKLTTVVIVAIHLLTCLWYLVGTYGATNLDDISNFVNGSSCPTPIEGTVQDRAGSFITWFTSKNNLASSLLPSQLYLLSFYFVVTTVTTTGFGDISPTNNNEMVVTMLIVLIGDVLYGGIIGVVVVSTFNAHFPASKRRDGYRTLKMYLKNRKIVGPVVQAIEDYQLKNEERLIDGKNETEWLTCIPDHLRKELSFALYESALRDVSFFSNLHEGLLRLLSMRLTPVFMTKNQNIIFSGERTSEMYFLLKGTISIRVYDSDMVQGALSPPENTLKLSPPENTLKAGDPAPAAVHQDSGVDPSPSDSFQRTMMKMKKNRESARNLATASFRKSHIDVQVEVIKKVAKRTASSLKGFHVFFGEDSFFTGLPRAAAVSCFTDCELLVLTRDSYDKLLANYPGYMQTIERAYHESKQNGKLKRYHADGI